MTSERIITLAFELGAKDVRICESSNANVIRDNRKQILSPKVKPCTRPDFFREVVLEEVKRSMPTLLFLVLPHESAFQSYSNEFFNTLLSENGYTAVKRSSLVKTDFTSLNIYLFIRSDRIHMLGSKSNSVVTHRTLYTKSFFSNGKFGAISFRFPLYINNVEKMFTFSGVCLPHDDEEEIPEPVRNKKLIFLYELESKVFRHKGRSTHYGLMVGDFGFLLYAKTRTPVNIANLNLGQLQDMDHLLELLRVNSPNSALYGFKEGFEGKGPNFFPTFQLDPNRDVNVCHDLVKDVSITTPATQYFENCIQFRSNPSGWLSRILWFSQDQESNMPLYYAVDYGNTRKIETAALVGVIDF